MVGEAPLIRNLNLTYRRKARLIAAAVLVVTLGVAVHRLFGDVAIVRLDTTIDPTAGQGGAVTAAEPRRTAPPAATNEIAPVAVGPPGMRSKADTATKARPPTTAPQAERRATSRESRDSLEVVRLTNYHRAQRGCAPLQVDSRLRQAAQGHSRDMAVRDYFNHTSPDGRTPWDRMETAGYTEGAAENLARGYGSPSEVVAGWMRSASHRYNILNCAYRSVGVGVKFGPDGPWWTQDFGYD